MEMIDGKESWKFPDDSMKPDVTEQAGANYFQRLEQVVYFNIPANSYIDVKIAKTVLLELEVVTEFTIDEFWDSTDLPRLLAVMLNIPQSKVKLMNVISESQGRSLSSKIHLIPEHMRKTKPKSSKASVAERSECTQERSRAVFVQFEIDLEDIEAAIEANFGSLDEIDTYEKVQEKQEEIIDASDDLITYKANKRRLDIMSKMVQSILNLVFLSIHISLCLLTMPTVTSLLVQS